ncbi:hypothetical protein D3C87_1235620 [compost metagenome]
MDHGLRHADFFQMHRMVPVAQRVTGQRFLQPDDGRDVASHEFVALDAVVRLHFVQPCRTLASPGARIEHRVAAPKPAAIDPHEHHRAVLVGDDLERKGRKGRCGVACHLHLAGFRQPVHDGVEQGLHATVAERRTGEHGHEGTRQHTLADAHAQHVGRRLFASQVGMHRCVVLLDCQLHEPCAMVQRRGQGIGRHVRHAVRLAGIVLVPDERTHADQVDHTAEVAFRADGQLHRHGFHAETLFHHRDHAQEIRAEPVELVDEGDARHAVLVREAPIRLGLWLHACNAVEHDHGTIEHTQRTVHFDVEVDVAGRVDQVDLRCVPADRDGRAADGDAALLLLRLEVHAGRATAHVADAMALAGIEQDAFGGGGLARVDVGNDADVADVSEFRVHDESF